MTVKEKNCIQKLMNNSSIVLDSKKLSLAKDTFLKDFSVDIKKISNYIHKLLKEAFEEKNAEDVDMIIYIGFTFNAFTDEFTDILCKLIEADWHFKHEDIASILKKLGSPDSVDSLYEAIINPLKYLDYSDAYPLEVKCIWALGKINTSQSIEKLQILSQSENEFIKENALNQLNMMKNL